jgi:transcriptional regulator with XRE-family HTH domain
MKSEEYVFEKSIIQRVVMLKNDKESDSAFAVRCGMKQSTFSGYVNRGKSPSVLNLKLIAEANSVSLDWLITGEGQKMRGGEAGRKKLDEEVNSKDPFNLAMDAFFEMVKEWQANEKGRTMETAMKFSQEFPLRFPEYTEWSKKLGGYRGSVGE